MCPACRRGCRAGLCRHISALRGAVQRRSREGFGIVTSEIEALTKR
jgi:hypothetical protein